MQNFIRPILTVIIGIILGFFLYQQFSPKSLMLADETDSQTTTVAKSDDIQQNISDSRENAITKAVKKVSPAIVSVNVTKINKIIQRNPYNSDPFFRQFFPEQFRDRIIEQPFESVGSGFIISSDGFVITNEHVAGNAEEIIVATSDGEEYKAELIGKDRVSDIALLKLDKENLPFVTLGNSDQVLIGEWAIALGNPFGLFVNNEPTVTVGVISAVNRDFSPYEGRIYEDMIQTDAAINNGNSGGPLCNSDGEVVGMNTFILTGDNRSKGSVGVGFAIPSNHIQQILERLKTRNKGDEDIWIGMSGINLNRYLARLVGYNSTLGFIVKQIDAKGPAANAGIELGDIVLTINGLEVHNTQAADQLIRNSDLLVGDRLKVLIWRSGKQFEKTIVLEKYPN